MIAVTLGEKVAQFRRDRNWSQEDLEEYVRNGSNPFTYKLGNL